MTYWLAVTTPENWEKCAKTRTWGTTDRFEGMMKRVHRGDMLVAYVTGLTCAGVFQVTEPYYWDEKPIWSEKYPHRIRFESVEGLVPAKPVDMRQFFNSFFPTISAAGYFRTMFRELPENEFELFRDFLRQGYVQTMEVGSSQIEAAEQAGFELSLERDLEAYLEGNLAVLEEGLRLFKQDRIAGRQFVTDVSRIDLLGQDSEGRFVVIELKAGEADRSVLGQILPYMGWVKQYLARGKQVRGIVVASEFAPELVAATKVVPELSLYKYAVNFSFMPVGSPTVSSP